MLYPLIPAVGVGEVTTILPVVAVQVAGWVKLTVGAAGAVGAGLIVTSRAGETQPAAFFTVTL
jgi:hypothetical protein